MSFKILSANETNKVQEHLAPNNVFAILPCLPGSTMYRVAHKINGEAYVSTIKDVSFEIFKDFLLVRDSEAVSYIYGAEVFVTENEAEAAAEKENEEREAF